MVAGQPREQQAQPAVRLHVEPDRAVVDLPTQEAAAVGMPLRGVAQVLAEQAAVLSVSAADERPTGRAPREQPLTIGGRVEEMHDVVAKVFQRAECASRHIERHDVM